MRHSFNLKRISDKAAPKGSNKNTFYMHLNSAMDGAYKALPVKDLERVKKAVSEETESVIAFIDGLISTQKTEDKKGGK